MIPDWIKDFKSRHRIGSKSLPLFILWKIPFVITEGSLEQIRTWNWFYPLEPFSFRVVNTSLVSVWYWYCFGNDHLRFTGPADAFSFFKFLKNLKFSGHPKKNSQNFRNFPFGSTLERRFWIVSPFSLGWMSLWIPLELNSGSKVNFHNHNFHNFLFLLMQKYFCIF